MSNSFNIGSIVIHYYSLFILLGIIIAYILITKEAKKNNIKDEDISNIIFYGLMFGILGARIHYVLFNLDFYLNHLDEIIKIWHGGLAIHGGIIFGMIFVYIYSKRKNISFLKLLDIILPCVILAQAIGRWGNFFNQEAHGIMVSKDLLHKLLVPKFVINGMYIDGNYYLPTFYFESIFCFIGFIIMMIMKKKSDKLGLITGFYLIWYGILRIIIEIFRTDSLMFLNMKVAILISLISIIAGIIVEVKNDVFRKN